MDALSPAADARTDSHAVPFTPWDAFMRRFSWRQGEHVTVIGPTGTGKTTVLRAILPKRYDAHGSVLVLATKSQDTNLDSWARSDHLARVDQWPPRAPFWKRPGDIQHADGHVTPWDRRVMLWPRPFGMELGAVDDHIADVHRRAMTDAYWSGGWTIVGEELYELSQLGLDRELTKIWTQGRSAGLSLVGATQRPVNIPLYAYSQATHLFMFRDNDEVNLKRLQGIGGMSGRSLAGHVASLVGHDVLYINTRTRELIRTRVPIRKVK